MTSVKIRLHILYNHLSEYFLKWELPYFRKHFDVVDEPSPDTVLLAFGPDMLETASELPALRRTALLFPWIDYNPYHNHVRRSEMLAIIDDSFDAVFVNPGPVQQALSTSKKLHVHPFSVDVEKLQKFKRPRTKIDRLLHVSFECPQKDWERSQRVMELTGLGFEVFPPRRNSAPQRVTWKDRIMWRYNKYIVSRISPTAASRTTLGYANHLSTIKKYAEYDGFVHVAADKVSMTHLDGKYTAALLEAAVTGSIIFWHDTFSNGNDFETVFPVSREPEVAAKEIREIRNSIDVERHSRRTAEEISDRCHPGKVVGFRKTVLENLLG